VRRQEDFSVAELFGFVRNPPPDLAIEVEMSHSLVDRIGIFAAMGGAVHTRIGADG
jgi:hypothetical protein